MNPKYLDENSIPHKELDKLKIEIENSQILQSKPKNIRENIAKGMLRKKLSEITLLDQEFVMEKISVLKYLINNSAKAIKMIRYEVGECI
jgi:elongation factor Ts